MESSRRALRFKNEIILLLNSIWFPAIHALRSHKFNPNFNLFKRFYNNFLLLAMFVLKAVKFRIMCHNSV